MRGAALAVLAAGLASCGPAVTPIAPEVAPQPVPPGQIRWPDASPGAAPALAEARRLVERAFELYAARQDDEADQAVLQALGACERARVTVPELASYHVQTVLTAVGHKDFAEADRRAARWLDRHPEDFAHHFLQGQARHQLRRWALAAESFRAAARLRPDSVDTQRWLAQTCLQMGLQEEAVRAAKASLAGLGFPANDPWAHPIAPQVFRNAVHVFHRFQEYEALEAAARAYQQKHPELPEYGMSLGVALAHLGRFQEAEPLLRRARDAPQNAVNAGEISFALSLVLAKAGNWREAANELAELLARDPFHTKAYYQLSLVYHRLGKGSAAEAMAAKSRELAPSEREMRRGSELRAAGYPGRAAASEALGHSLRGELREAESGLRLPELREDPHGVFALADLYRDALRLDDQEKVLAHAQTLPRVAPAEIAGRRALALVARGEVEQGLAALQAIAAAPGANEYWMLRLAETLLGAGQAAAAARLLTPLRTGDDAREVSFLLARALIETGEPARGLELLGTISTGDTRWDDWQGEAWQALAAALAADASAERRIAAVPEAQHASLPWLRARAALLPQTGPPAAASEAQQALERFQRAEAAIIEVRRRIARLSWPATAPHYLELGRLHRERGENGLAVRQARLAEWAVAGSVDALRALGDWLDGPGDAFLRLHTLRSLEKASPGDARVQAAREALEAQWLRH